MTSAARQPAPAPRSRRASAGASRPRCSSSSGIAPAHDVARRRQPTPGGDGRRAPADDPVRGGDRPRGRPDRRSRRAIGSRSRSSHARATAGRSAASRRGRCRPAACPGRAHAATAPHAARPVRAAAIASRRPPSDRPTCRISTGRRVPADLAAAVDPGGLKREVFGFLPYWELTDSSTRLDWEKLSTIAYFGVGAAANGNLQKRNSGRLDHGRLERLDELEDDRVINAAHANGTRVVLTVQSFAWTSSGRGPPEGAARQLGDRAPTSPARSRRPCAIAAPTASTSTSSRSSSTYADEFTALVRHGPRRARHDRAAATS